MSSTTVVRQLFGAFDGFRRGDPCGSSAAFAAKVDGGDLPGDGAATTFPMGFAYVEAYAAARSCLAALADTSDCDDSCLYERLLIDLDGIHGGDFPATYPMLGTLSELLAHLEDCRSHRWRGPRPPAS